MASLLVVEDEPHIASGLRFNLEADGHDVRVVDSGEDALRALAHTEAPIDCMILDVMLPGLDGFSVAAAARARGWFHPILMLTARARAEDVLKGFEAGADDYLPKPFELSILVARVNALLRRRAWQSPVPESAISPDVFEFAGRVVDFNAQELRNGTQVHHLTLMETNLLRYLVQREGQAVSRKNMLEDVWNLREDTDTRAIDHFIARLRKYIEKEPAKPKHVLTVRGVGYKFVVTPR
ncbi:MAG TPA: response regulator transcription factor [Vicinamibacterales bacterium]|nr:response regulator transcription factor [Vicinamibacterales bacterium]